MLEVNNSLNNFERSLAQLAVKPAQNHSYWSKVLTYFGSSRGPKENLLAVSLDEYISILGALEKIPVLFNASKNRMDAQQETFARAIQAGKTLKHLIRASELADQPNGWAAVAVRIAALKYRIEGSNGGLCRSNSNAVYYSRLKDAAAAWKKNSSMMVRKVLTPNDLQKLEIASGYEKFAKAVLADRGLLESFFVWALRDNMGVEQFVEFPEASARIKSSFLAARCGRYGGAHFKILRSQVPNGPLDTVEKVITLPFFIDRKVEQVNILDESREVVLEGGWRLTITSAIDIFARKNREIGNLEFFQSTGITNWNSHEHGYWDPVNKKYARIDLTVDNWWEQLPVLEEISKEELELRYDVPLADGAWLACAKSARATPDLDVDGQHGFIEVSIPYGNGSYRVYPFGNFASENPHGILTLLGFLVDTVRGKVSFPDENFFYSQRQIASFPFDITDAQGKELMKVIRTDMIKSRHGFQIFQFGGENCAFWAQRVLHTVFDHLPNFYKMPIIQSKPSNPFLKGLFKFFRATPGRLQKRVIGAVEGLLGSGRTLRVFDEGEEAFKSHKTSAPHAELAIYQPGLLHKQIEDKKLKGTITYGHG